MDDPRRSDRAGFHVPRAARRPRSRGAVGARRSRRLLSLRDTARAMSQENVEVVRKGVDAWNQHDAGLWLSYAAPDVEWMPAGPAAVEQTVYRGHNEVASGFAAIWQTWDLFQCEEAQIRDL